jgi:methyl-accepting chemotaxis protein
VTDIIGEIAAASEEQSSGIDQVNKAVSQMDAVVQSNAAQTEQLSSTAQSLSTQAQQLQTLVRKFKLGEDGERSAMVTTPATQLMRGEAAEAFVAKPLQRQKQSSASAATSHSGGHRASAANGSTKHVDGGFEEF